MPVFLYDIYQNARDAITWATAPARAVVAFLQANPKTSLALWAASLVVAIRYL